MKGFISELAERLYDRYGDEVSSLRMVFPSRRARLFFSDALASVARRPLWQPRFESLGEIMERVAGMRLSDEIKLVTELYKVYSRYHDESFDAFYFWGGMLLADFDQIDKYLIDADMLFSNMGDLKALESDRSYLTAEQIEVIARFWRSFGLESEFSEEKERFMTIWRSMADVYHGFRDRLREQGLAYEGMIRRAPFGRGGRRMVRRSAGALCRGGIQRAVGVRETAFPPDVRQRQGRVLLGLRRLLRR